MDRRQFLLASAALAAGCGRGPIPFGGGPQAPDSDAARIREDLQWQAENARVRSRDWVPPDAKRTVPPPFDFAAAVPELAARWRTAVLLHPRYSEEPPADGSKVGGTLLWPAAEPWPTCDAHPALRLVPVLQLRADAFPEVGFPPGKDLLQVLWCPREHERCWAKPSLFWRRRDAVDKPLAAMPVDEAAYPRYVPQQCRLFPERVIELPSPHELGPLLEKLDDWNRRERKFPGKQMESVVGEATPYLGWKVGGWPDWVQGPEVPVCECGRPMELLLTYGSEYKNVAQAPTQEHRLYAAGRKDWAAVENAANAPLVRFIGDGVQFTFVCRRCPGWPAETISQC
jgi:hypothetical protein